MARGTHGAARHLSGHYPFPKPILNTWILSIQQTTGVYSPFTVEANYNRDIAYYDIPFTICHELSHLRGYMQEEDANFIGVLATIGADDLYFNYSGYVSAWVYAGNALARIASTAFGVRSYRHVTDLMLEYFAKNGTLTQ